MSVRSDSVFGSLMLIAATPVAAWWLIGDQSEAGPGADYYMVKPLDLGDSGSRHVVGAIALVIAIGGLVLVLRAGPIPQRRLWAWHRALGLIVLAEVLVTAMYRTMTAGVIGANIGGGMALFFGSPVVGVILGMAWNKARNQDEWLAPVLGATVGLVVTVLAFVSLWLSLLLFVAMVAAVTVTLERHLLGEPAAVV